MARLNNSAQSVRLLAAANNFLQEEAGKTAIGIANAIYARNLINSISWHQSQNWDEYISSPHADRLADLGSLLWGTYTSELFEETDRLLATLKGN